MTITLAVAGVRSSSLDSGGFSPIPIIIMPFKTQKTKKQKKYFVDPKQTVRIIL